MSVIKKNILANFGGSLWTGLMGLIFVPLYIRFMGIEAYGLVGLFSTVLALSSLLDMGLSQTLNREMARLAVEGNKSRDMRDLLRTLELPYWAVGLFIGGVVVLLSRFVAYHWVSAEALSPVTIRRAVSVMGIAAGVQWPLSLYSGGLMGLQRQVLLNSLNAIMAACRGLGALLVLWLIAPTVGAFFAWQIFISATHTVLVAFALWHSLPGSIGRARFRRDLLGGIWRFAAGVAGISVLATILTQLDKVILSRMLSLEVFGYYSLASAISVSISRIFGPVLSATYPRLTNLYTLGAQEELSRLYHKSAQLVSVLALPAAVVIILFSGEILWLWTQDSTIAERTHPLVSILVAGTALNGLMSIPYALQLASGWTRLTLVVNLVAVLLLGPLTIIFTGLCGPVGAASVWVILNGGYVLIAIPMMHRRLLPTEKWRWYFGDVGLPLAVALLVASVFRLILPMPTGNLALGVDLLMISTITLAATVLTTPVTRCCAYTQISKWKASHAAAY